MEGTTAGCRRLCVFSALSLLLLLAACAQSALAAEPLGAISGQVTEASSHAPLQGIEVCAYSTNFEMLSEQEAEPAVSCAATNAGGTYTVSALQPENYFVEFSAGAAKLNFITQYYAAKLTSSEATAVVVTAGKTASGVDAQLAPGAQIAGRVTDASTGAPIERVSVVALRTKADGTVEFVSAAPSGANGEYTVAGLPTGSYNIAFFAPNYALQYFDNKPTRAEAALISVIAPGLTSGINAGLQPRPTIRISGSPFGPSAPHAQLPGSGRPEGRLSLLGGRIAVSGRGVGLVKLDCVGSAPCRARLALKIDRTIVVKRKRTLRTITIGTSAALSIAAGHTVTEEIKLDAAGRRMLRAHRGHLRAALELVTPGHAREERVILTERVARH